MKYKKLATYNLKELIKTGKAVDIFGLCSKMDCGYSEDSFCEECILSDMYKFA